MTVLAPSVSPAERWVGFAALAAGLALIVLDGTIVGVALPAIVADLHLALTDAQWVTSLYSVVFAALLLTSGRLGDHVGRRRMFIAGVALFIAASLAGAGAGDAAWLVGARAVQGVGGAMVLPSTLSTVNATFRGRDRAVAFGIWGAVMAGAAAVGPLLGGWLTTTLGWRWIFVVNLPLGVAILLASRLVPETSEGRTLADFDRWGLVTSVVGLGLLVFGLIEGATLGWLTPARELTILGLTWPTTAPISIVPVALAVGTVVTVGFLALERHRATRQRAVILDLSLFAVPTFAWGNLTAAAVAVGEFALLFVLPLYLVDALQLSILQAGWVLASMALGAFIAGAQARKLAAELGPPRVVTVGLVLELAAVAAAAVMIPSGTSPWLIALLMAGYGLGLGLAAAQLTSTVLQDVPTAQSGAASATQSTVRQLGSALGAALAGTVLAIGFQSTVPTQLAKVAGVTADDATVMVEYMTGTAGAVISMIRTKGTHGHFGTLGPQVADALTLAFAQSVGWVLWLGAAFLVLGVAGVLGVERAAAFTVRSVPGPTAVQSGRSRPES